MQRKRPRDLRGMGLPRRPSEGGADGGFLKSLGRLERATYRGSVRIAFQKTEVQPRTFRSGETSAVPEGANFLRKKKED